MNKYKGALDCLYGCSVTNIINHEYEPHIKKMKEYRSILQNLVERATPKEANLRSNYDGLVIECPCCHEEFRPETVMGYVQWKGCPYCLQELDWSEVEKNE